MGRRGGWFEATRVAMSDEGDCRSSEGMVSVGSFWGGVGSVSTVFSSRAVGFESSMGGQEKRNKTSIKVPEITLKRIATQRSIKAPHSSDF